MATDPHRSSRDSGSTPSDAALSAVEEALKFDLDDTSDDGGVDLAPGVEDQLREDGTGTSAREGRATADPFDEADGPAAPFAPANDEEDATPPAPRRRRHRALAKQQAAANDDRGRFEAALASGRRRGVTAYAVATMAAVGWFAFGVIAAVAGLAEQGAGAFVTSPQAFAVLGATAAPILLFYMMAFLANRSEEMRVTASAMTEIAQRLTEPEINATEGVVSIGQAIRREVAGMSEGIEQALERASELEVLVHREVSTLERSYTDHEAKIRSLFEELVAEREMLVAHSDRIRDEIEGAKAGLAELVAGLEATVKAELQGATGEIGETFHAESRRIAEDIRTSGQTLLTSFVTSGDGYVERMVERSRELEARLAETGEAAASRVAEASQTQGEAVRGFVEALITALNDQSEATIAAVKSASETLVGSLQSEAGQTVESLRSTAEYLVRFPLRREAGSDEPRPPHPNRRHSHRHPSPARSKENQPDEFGPAVCGTRDCVDSTCRPAPSPMTESFASPGNTMADTFLGAGRGGHEGPQ